MVNHIQTLLLDESASVVSAELPAESYGFIDPSFTRIDPDRNISAVYSDLFGGMSVSEKFAVVRECLPYIHMPEFAKFFREFDTRVTYSLPNPSSVFSLYSSMTGDSSSRIVSVALSRNAPLVFLPTGDGLVDEALESVRAVYNGTGEVVKKFAAVLYGVTLHLHAAFERSSSR